MYKIIASSLFLHKKCTLSGIGTLSLVAHSAVADFLNTRIQAPSLSIEFIPNTNDINLSPELNEVSTAIFNKLDKDGSISIDGVGTFTKVTNGLINFSAISLDSNFIQAVRAEKVIRQEAVHEILVGDQQSTNIEMEEYFNNNKSTLERWKISAIVLFSISLLLMLFYLSQRGVNLFGNIGF
jgi:hypothetical protein